MDSTQQLIHQYSTSQNLAARIDVHERFSTNPYRWMRWVFDHFDFPEPCRMLELGCGVGKLWLENANRIRPTWSITVTDFSASMLAQTKANLADVHAAFDFQLLGSCDGIKVGFNCIRTCFQQYDFRLDGDQGLIFVTWHT